MAFHETRFETAHDLFTEVITLDPEFRLGWAYLAAVDMLLFRDPSASVAEARKLAEGRSRGERQMGIALVHFALGELEACQGAIVDVLRAAPDDRFANHVMGFVTSDLGQTDDAIEILRELLRTHSDFHPAWNHLGYAFLESDQLAFAGESFRRFLNANPDNPSAHDSMAGYLARKGDIESAVNHLNRAVELEPRMSYAWMHMGDLLAEAEMPEQARPAYEKAAETSVLYGEEFRAIVAEKLDSLDQP